MPKLVFISETLSRLMLERHLCPMIGFPNAKINLGLDVLEKRADGYHNISSVFYPVSHLFDVLEIIPGKSNSDNFFFSGLAIPGQQEGNLVVKALQLIREDHPIPPLDVYLHKVIPMGAGLGGGSSDGSSMLRLLNDLFALNLDVETLKFLALELGSDCPFFIENKPALAQGRGEQLRNIDIDLRKRHLAIAFSDIHISTAEAYQNVERVSMSNIEVLVLDKNFKRWKNDLTNGFEPHALKQNPQLKNARQYLYNKGAVYASMTGSGSAIYGLFNEEPGELSLEGFKFWKGPA